MRPPFVVVTGASSGIGFALARICAGKGFDLVAVADRPPSHGHRAVEAFRHPGAQTAIVETDLATAKGVEQVLLAVNGRPVDALLVNIGHGPGPAFLHQDFSQVKHVLDTSVTGTLCLVQHIARQMCVRGQGRILFTASMAGFTPRTYRAVHDGTRAFIESFSFALHEELKGTGVTVSCLTPSATYADSFECADLLQPRLDADNDDSAELVHTVFGALMADDGDVASGWKQKSQSPLADVTPAAFIRRARRAMDRRADFVRSPLRA